MTDITEPPEHAQTPPSRSRQRREALAVLELAERLVALSPAELTALPIPDDIRTQIAETQAIISHIAHKRQLQFLAKHLRRADPELLVELREHLAHARQIGQKANAALHRLERWRQRLLAEGDAALADLLAEHPDADRQRLRQLLRNARHEVEHCKPPRAQRELLRALRELA